MTLHPQIALFTALLAALSGPARAGSPEETEASELRRARISLRRIVQTEPRPYTINCEAASPGWDYEVEVVPPFPD